MKGRLILGSESSASLTLQHGKQRSGVVPEIQEVLSLNQAQTRDRPVDHGQKPGKSRKLWRCSLVASGLLLCRSVDLSPMRVA